MCEDEPAPDKGSGEQDQRSGETGSEPEARPRDPGGTIALWTQIILLMTAIVGAEAALTNNLLALVDHLDRRGMIVGHAIVQNLRRGNYDSASTPATWYGSRWCSPSSLKRSDPVRLLAVSTDLVTQQSLSRPARPGAT
jgi:hypothetical protein